MFSNTFDYATRAGKKRPLTIRNIRRLADRAIDKHPKAFIKIIGDALGLIKVLYNLPPEDPECQRIAGMLLIRAKRRHTELGIEMEMPKPPVEGGPPDMKAIDATPPLGNATDTPVPEKETAKTETP